MAEDLVKIDGTREEKYASLYPQIQSLLAGETDKYANLANIAAAVHEVFGFFWVGFYLTKENQLVLGPFQGPVACTRIPFHKGVCGHAYTTKQTILVPDVEVFPGHIACASASDQLADFSEVDQQGLEKVIRLIEESWITWS
jgi:GAF domain-containing protein